MNAISVHLSLVPDGKASALRPSDSALRAGSG